MMTIKRWANALEMFVKLDPADKSAVLDVLEKALDACRAKSEKGQDSNIIGKFDL